MALRSKSAVLHVQYEFASPRLRREVSMAPGYSAEPMEITPVNEDYADLPQLVSSPGTNIIHPAEVISMSPQSASDVDVIIISPQSANEAEIPPIRIHFPNLLQAVAHQAPYTPQSVGEVLVMLCHSAIGILTLASGFRFPNLLHTTVHHVSCTTQGTGEVWEVPSRSTFVMSNTPKNIHSISPQTVASEAPCMLQAMRTLHKPTEMASKQVPEHQSNIASFGQSDMDMEGLSNGQGEEVRMSVLQGKKAIRAQRTMSR